MLQDFLNFDRYLTPSIIRISYFLQIALIASGVAGIISAISTLFLYSFFGGLLMLCATLLTTAAAIVGARIVTEIIMVLFQNNEHLAAIRARAEGR